MPKLSSQRGAAMLFIAAIAGGVTYFAAAQDNEPSPPRPAALPTIGEDSDKYSSHRKTLQLAIVGHGKIPPGANCFACHAEPDEESEATAWSDALQSHNKLAAGVNCSACHATPSTED